MGLVIRGDDSIRPVRFRTGKKEKSQGAESAEKMVKDVLELGAVEGENEPSYQKRPWPYDRL